MADYYDRGTLTAMVKPPFKPTGDAPSIKPPETSRLHQEEPGNEFR